MMKTERDVYIRHIRRLVAERDELKEVITAERKLRRDLVKEYYKRINSRFRWFIDYWMLTSRRNTEQKSRGKSAQ